jgi:hypothetical protein
LQRFTRKTGSFVSRGAHLALDDLDLLACPLEAIPRGRSYASVPKKMFFLRAARTPALGRSIPVTC